MCNQLFMNAGRQTMETTTMTPGNDAVKLAAMVRRELRYYAKCDGNWINQATVVAQQAQNAAGNA
jgi:hypothetical protein